MYRNLKTVEGRFVYENGDPVPGDLPIHMHSNGVTMTGAMHTKESKRIYEVNAEKRVKFLKRLSNKISKGSI